MEYKLQNMPYGLSKVIIKPNGKGYSLIISWYEVPDYVWGNYCTVWLTKYKYWRNFHNSEVWGKPKWIKYN